MGVPPSPEKTLDLGISGFGRAVLIGRGGFARVYRAWQPAFHRYVVIKVITAELDDRAVNRFERECAAIGALSGHPNIVTVFGSGRTADGQPYLAMEYLSGGSLVSRVVAGRMDWREAVAAGVCLAGALESAHRAGILHRDVKPANVLVSEYGEFKLADFGIARTGHSKETTTGVVTATLLYAAPEVLEGQRPSPATDVYSLASTLYTLLAGRPAFAPSPGESDYSVMRRVLSEPLPAMPRHVPAPVARVIEEAMSRDRTARPTTALEFGRALQEAQRASVVPITDLPLALDTAIAEARADYEPTTTVAPTPAESSTVRQSRSSVRTANTGGWKWTVVGALVAVIAIGAYFSIAGPLGGGSQSVGTPTTAAMAAPTVVNSQQEDGEGSSRDGVDRPATTDAARDAMQSGGGTTVAVQGVRLGPDLAPVGSEPCGPSTTATGSTWQIATVTVGGQSLANSYYCSLFAGSAGSLDFVLGGGYRSLRMTVGFADTSGSTSHNVRHEFIADGREYLIEPFTLRFGEVRNLELDVQGVTRLQIRVSEVSPPGGSEAPSRPVLGAPVLVR